MELDVRTMFVVTIVVTALLGLLLIYVWNQNRKISSLAWWGGAHIVASAAVWMIGLRGSISDLWSIEISNALLFTAAGMTWAGARLFDGNRPSLIGIFGGAFAWLLATRMTDLLSVPKLPIVVSSMIIAAYTFAAATEIWKGRADKLHSRLPLTVILSTHGALYLLRVPLTIAFPGKHAESLLSTTWFGVIGLEMLLYMIAAAFVLLAMAKERTELEHKMAAATDPLTGVANRRAFLAEAREQLKQRKRASQPASVLLFDLDRFKSINDHYGHAIGDQVLQCFAKVALAELRSSDLFGRLGGEEFGALLFGAEANVATATAERIRAAFAAAFGKDGNEAGISVSIGVATVSANVMADIETLLMQADEALYVAKARGRNRVELMDDYASRRREAFPRDEEMPLQAVASPGVVPSEAAGAAARHTMAAARPG